MENSQIREKLFRGIKDVFYYYLHANIDGSHYIKPEYLLTVKIAESLSVDNKEYKIKIEEPTSDFANSCVKCFNNGFSTLDHNSQRNGKIDIAIYSTKSGEDHYPSKPLFPIEIKNINPSKFEFLEDVSRNLDFFKIVNEIGGKSVIDKAYHVSIEELKDIYSEDFQAAVTRLEKKYEKWLKDSGLFTADEIEFEVYTQNVDCDPVSRSVSFDPTEGATEGDFLGNYYYVGIVIELRRKLISVY